MAIRIESEWKWIAGTFAPEPSSTCPRWFTNDWPKTVAGQCVCKCGHPYKQLITSSLPYIKKVLAFLARGSSSYGREVFVVVVLCPSVPSFCCCCCSCCLPAFCTPAPEENCRPKLSKRSRIKALSAPKQTENAEFKCHHRHKLQETTEPTPYSTVK